MFCFNKNGGIQSLRVLPTTYAVSEPLLEINLFVFSINYQYLSPGEFRKFLFHVLTYKENKSQPQAAMFYMDQNNYHDCLQAQPSELCAKFPLIYAINFRDDFFIKTMFLSGPFIKRVTQGTFLQM